MTIPKHLCDVFPKQHDAFLKDLFHFCPHEILQRISIQRYPKHVHLIDTSEDNEYVFLLLEGKLQAIEERVVNIPYQFLEVKPIDIVGDYEVFSQTQGHYITLKTIEPSLCLKLSAPLYQQWMRHDANALFLRTKMIIEVLSVQTQQQRQFLFMDTTQRLSVFLIEKMQEHTTSLLLKDTREQIASHIGCSVRQLNRILHQLVQQEHIQLVHGKLFIPSSQYIYFKEKAELDF